jgi:hypothetical protein
MLFVSVFATCTAAHYVEECIMRCLPVECLPACFGVSFTAAQAAGGTQLVYSYALTYLLLMNSRGRTPRGFRQRWKTQLFSFAAQAIRLARAITSTLTTGPQTVAAMVLLAQQTP